MTTKVLVVLFGVAGALVHGPVFGAAVSNNTNEVRPAVVLNVTVQKVVSLTLPNAGGCTVATDADYSMNLGAVDARGINTGCASKFPPGVSVSSTFSKSNVSVSQPARAPAAITHLTAISSNAVSQTTVA